jgi:uncharacterized protein (TIGR02421 family)
VKPARKLDEDWYSEIRERLEAGKRVRRAIPGGGMLCLDRSLPFLIVYRTPPGADEGTPQLLRSEAAWMICPSGRAALLESRRIVETLAQSSLEQFGAFLLLEVWAASDDEDEQSADTAPRPRFVVRHERDGDPGRLVDVFEEHLSKIRLQRVPAEVSSRAVARIAPPRMSPILPRSVTAKLETVVMGLELRPIYRSDDGEVVFPVVLRQLRRSLSRAMRKTLHEFVRTRTPHRPKHFHVLGRRALVKAVWEVDGKLTRVSETFDFLLQASPANARAAWTEFQRRQFRRAPTLHYRPLTIDPSTLKRALYQVPVERIEDPALGLLLRQKQEELDRQITMLADRDTKRFLPGSVALYGKPDAELVTTARALLERIRPATREARAGPSLDAQSLARRAQQEIESYAKAGKRIDCDVEIRDDIASGLMVSRGRLLIGADTLTPASRVEALLQHEIGTHVLTYINAGAQPFQLLREGLAGYEALQEGLAVLAEYLVGGLSRPRLRLLAGRVIAVDGLVRGASFEETYRALVGEYGFAQRTAFTVTLRTHRGGGLTKDSLYLQGLREVLDYLGRGGRLRPLLVGKIAIEHVPIVRELQWREVLRDPPLLPRYLELPRVAVRLESVREGIGVLDLLEKRH